MAADTNVTNETSNPGPTTEQPVAPAAAEPQAAEPPVASPAAAQQQRAWSMPKSPVTRAQADAVGRFAVTALRRIAAFIAAAARHGARAVKHAWHAISAVPPALQLFFAAGILMLLGVVGAITLHTTLGLICIVVVVPVCAGILGALGHRWYSGLATEPKERTRPAEPAASDLQRAVHYVDKKLAVALTSLGTEHHQQAVIALFQVKTAVELALGTEQDTAGYVDVSLRADDYGLRPRIRAGSASTLPESNSLAAS